MVSKAANQNYAGAQHALGVCYFLGEGVKINRIKAKERFYKAANLGHENAKSALNEYFSDEE